MMQRECDATAVNTIRSPGVEYRVFTVHDASASANIRIMANLLPISFFLIVFFIPFPDGASGLNVPRPLGDDLYKQSILEH